MPGKKTSDSDEQFHTGLETLELWILVLQHHQSQQNMGHQEDHKPKKKEESVSSHLQDCASVWDNIYKAKQNTI
jgi:hypothetical protein